MGVKGPTEPIREAKFGSCVCLFGKAMNKVLSPQQKGFLLVCSDQKREINFFLLMSC